MLNLYKAEVRGEIDWDMFIGFIVAANSENEAAKIARDYMTDCRDDKGHKERLRVKKIEIARIKDPVVLLASYKAG
jgi:hypothetical protein